MHDLGSSFRAVPAEATLRLGRQLREIVGVSRVTDITRLDRLGLPVYASIRPRSETLRVHAGKGLRPLEAEVGALMEAVEHWAAEPRNNGVALEVKTIAEVATQLGRATTFVDLVPALGEQIDAAQLISTVKCEDLLGGGTVHLPAELIFFPFTEPHGPALFDVSTNGLASGNTVEEATLHALLEVVERDAVSMNSARDASAWIEPDSLPEPFAALSAKWRAAGVELGVRHVVNAFGLPCFSACLYEPASSDVNLAGGYGCHLDRNVALSRAVCEAAQSRLSFIHGGRDDIVPFYLKYVELSSTNRTEAERKAIALAFNDVIAIKFEDVPTLRMAFGSIAVALKTMLKLVRQAGFGAAFRYRFEQDLLGLQVVRVVVPRCESLDPQRRRIGTRLLQRILGDG